MQINENAMKKKYSDTKKKKRENDWQTYREQNATHSKHISKETKKKNWVKNINNLNKLIKNEQINIITHESRI